MKSRNFMKFDMDVWLKYYNKARRLGRYLKECSDEPERKIVLTEINEIMNQSDEYLDDCGLKSPLPLWKFSIHDPDTWISSPTFRYQHLLKEE